MARIRKDSGHYLVETSWYDNEGHRHYKSKGGLATKSAARKYAAELDTLKYGSQITDSTMTFDSYFDLWFTTYKKDKVALATEKRYMIYSKMIKNFFKKEKFNQVTRFQYQRFINQFGKTHAPSTVRKMNGAIRECVKSAIIDNIIVKDFTQHIKISGNDDMSLHVEYLSIEEINQLVSALLDGIQSRYTSRYMILMAIFTGARLGEIMALTWHDIDYQNKTISINKSWNYLGGGGFKKTKTPSSVRTIRVNDKLLKRLLDLKSNSTDLVFQNSLGYIPSSNAVNKTLRETMKKCGLQKRDFHFHSLRHSHVAYLLANGIPLYAISKRLGHSNTTITANKYAYLIDELKAKSDSRIAECLDKIG